MPADPVLSDEELAEIRAVGDNTRLDAAQGRHPGPRGRGAPGPLGARARSRPSWRRRWGIDPERDLRKSARETGSDPVHGRSRGSAAARRSAGGPRCPPAAPCRGSPRTPGSPAPRGSLPSLLGTASGCRRPARRRRGPARPQPAPRRVTSVSSESGRGVGRRLDLLVAVHVRELDRELDRAPDSIPPRSPGALLGHVELDPARHAPDDVVLLAHVDVEASGRARPRATLRMSSSLSGFGRRLARGAAQRRAGAGARTLLRFAHHAPRRRASPRRGGSARRRSPRRPRPWPPRASCADRGPAPAASRACRRSERSRGWPAPPGPAGCS